MDEDVSYKEYRPTKSTAAMGGHGEMRASSNLSPRSMICRLPRSAKYVGFLLGLVCSVLKFGWMLVAGSSIHRAQM